MWNHIISQKKQQQKTVSSAYANILKYHIQGMPLPLWSLKVKKGQKVIKLFCTPGKEGVGVAQMCHSRRQW